MWRILFVLLVFGVVLFSAYYLCQPTIRHHPGSVELMKQMNDPRFRAELAEEEWRLDELARQQEREALRRAATQPTSRPTGTP